MSLILRIAIATILFSCIPLVVKSVSANPVTIGLVRLVIASVCLFAYIKLKGQSPQLTKTQIKPLILIGALFSCHWITYFLSIQLSTASIGIIALSSYGVHILWINLLLGRHKITLADVFAISLAIIGVGLIVPELSFDNSITIGLLVGIISGFFYACLPFLHQAYPSLPSHTRALGQFVFALPLFILLSPWASWSLTTTDWLGLVFLALFCTVIAHTLWVQITTEVSTMVASLLYYLSLPITLVLSFLLLDEPMPAEKITGACLILFANVVGLHRQFKQQTFFAHKS